MRIVVAGATGNVGTSVIAAPASDARVSEIVGLGRRGPAAAEPAHHLGAADVLTAPLEDLFRAQPTPAGWLDMDMDMAVMDPRTGGFCGGENS